ncbi:MAG: ShlB/FhaC/HecB family hemolysin secretion/activation protein [Negativicutes bacterium]|nr:ShlB/FhaC/HecB family hemolysin secretion/activation protein [Negativicutes bacterium]MDR3591199.1 ShlB/FhaC/HecB family hemolysin secretion/activation protein [Negativicutes bacterium]
MPKTHAPARGRGKGCLSLLLAFMVCSTSPALAVEPPNAGTIKSSLEEQKLPEPAKNSVTIEINQEEKPGPVQDAGPKIRVNGFRVTGAGPVSQAELQELVKDAAGKELSLTEMQALAQRIAGYLNQRGYMVANAYVPAQDIKDGTVEITVVPGQYGQIDIRNRSHLKTTVAEGLLGPVKIGDYVKKDVLERALLLLSDTSGVSIKATLAPGKTAGSTDLILEITDTEDVVGTFSLDNYGNRYTGQGVSNMTLTINNVSGSGDVISLGNNYSGDGMNNASVSYLTPVGNQGAKLGVSFSNMHYLLGKEFASLDYTGKSNTTSIFETYPLRRSRDNNVNIQIGFDYRKLADKGLDITLADKRDYVWNFGINGDSRDKLGVNSYSLTLSSGNLSIVGGTDLYGYSAQSDDSQTAQTAGRYTKASFNYSRQQVINNRLSFLFDFSGQLANKNLDSSEKLFIGGYRGVRAYPEGEASGDAGYLARGELRLNMPTPELQLAAYIDTGHIVVNKNPWPGAGDNGRTLHGVGLGLITSASKDYTVRVDYAWKLGPAPVTSEADRKGRWWLSGVQYF